MLIYMYIPKLMSSSEKLLKLGAGAPTHHPCPPLIADYEADIEVSMLSKQQNERKLIKVNYTKMWVD